MLPRRAAAASSRRCTVAGNAATTSGVSAAAHSLTKSKALLAVGDSKPRHPDAGQLAAWTMLTNELFNLDEVLCK